jgi:hypothetical protein
LLRFRKQLTQEIRRRLSRRTTRTRSQQSRSNSFKVNSTSSRTSDRRK